MGRTMSMGVNIVMLALNWFIKHFSLKEPCNSGKISFNYKHGLCFMLHVGNVILNCFQKSTSTRGGGWKVVKRRAIAQLVLLEWRNHTDCHCGPQ